jgi:maltose-binding protein MalE
MPQQRDVKFVWLPMQKAMVAVAERAATPRVALEAAQKKLEESIAAAKK